MRVIIKFPSGLNGWMQLWHGTAVALQRDPKFCEPQKDNLFFNRQTRTAPGNALLISNNKDTLQKTDFILMN